jgi:hypothetical protein
MNDQLDKWLMKRSKTELIEIMLGALDEMQLYNGRSRQECIIRTIGGRVIEDEQGRVSFTLPPPNPQENSDE